MIKWNAKRSNVDNYENLEEIKYFQVLIKIYFKSHDLMTINAYLSTYFQSQTWKCLIEKMLYEFQCNPVFLF